MKYCEITGRTYEEHAVLATGMILMPSHIIDNQMSIYDTMYT